MLFYTKKFKNKKESSVKQYFEVDIWSASFIYEKKKCFFVKI